MGLLEMLAEGVIQGHRAKMNPNLTTLNQMRQLYPDQEIGDQTLLQGIEREMQRINPSARLPREDSPSSPFQTQLAPGEASPVSDAMVQNYQQYGGRIKPISPEGSQLWSFDKQGNLVKTGARLGKGDKVVSNPFVEMMRENEQYNQRQDSTFNRQADLEDIHHQHNMEHTAFQGRINKSNQKPVLDPMDQLDLYKDNTTGASMWMSRRQYMGLNDQQRSNVIPYRAGQQQSNPFDEFLKEGDQGGGSAGSVQTVPNPFGAPQQSGGSSAKPGSAPTSRDAAREALRKRGFEIPK